jgi:hypothetical protein
MSTPEVYFWLDFSRSYTNWQSKHNYKNKVLVFSCDDSTFFIRVFLTYSKLNSSRLNSCDKTCSIVKVVSKSKFLLSSIFYTIPIVWVTFRDYVILDFLGFTLSITNIVEIGDYLSTLETENVWTGFSEDLVDVGSWV